MFDGAVAAQTLFRLEAIEGRRTLGGRAARRCWRLVCFGARLGRRRPVYWPDRFLGSDGLAGFGALHGAINPMLLPLKTGTRWIFGCVKM